MKKFLFVLAFVVALCTVKAADWTPLQISIFAPDYQVSPTDMSVSGLKFNFVYGSNDEITGLDLGFASNSKKASGVQLNALANIVHDSFSGLQFGLVNADEKASGLMVGGLNVVSDRMKGVQIGAVNSAMEARGVQIGLVNYTEFMTGFQFGIVNIITMSKLPVFVGFNFCF